MSGSGPIPRLNAALESRYAIERELGEGGMATVYLADDLKHERKVALKVLKRELAAVVGAKRFLAEIKTTASLAHPNILPLHDSGEADGFLFYVMPYVEGESLRDRLDREHQLPVDEAVRIACDMAETLDCAHRHDVIHRDIKPANVLLVEGRPEIADFGIALAVRAGGGSRLTETGLSLGTPHYMSPEQSAGDEAVGAATDTYALGCVLYEMLVGEPPFTGGTPQAILSKIIASEPVSVMAQRKSVPPNVDAAISKALEKLPADRFADSQDFARALTDPAFQYGSAVVPEVAGGVGPWRRVSVVFASLSVAASALAGWGWFRPFGTAPPDVAGIPVRMDLAGFRLTAPVGSDERIAISPDGSRIILASVQNGVSRLYVRRADEVEFAEIAGTEDANHPSFSPDGEWVVFDTDAGEIRRVALSGGPVMPVADGSYPQWGLDGSLVFVDGGSIYRMSDPGGEPDLILQSDSLFPDTRRPHILPDGGAVVFQIGEALENRRLMLLEIGSGVVTDLRIGGNNPRYVPTGHLVFGDGSQALMAVPFDLDTHRVSGAPATVLPDVLVYNGGATQFAVSETGTAVVGLRGIGAQDRELVIVGLDGSESPLPLAGDFSHPRFSPSGRRIAYRRLADASEDMEILYYRDNNDRPMAMSLDGSTLIVEVETLDRGGTCCS